MNNSEKHTVLKKEKVKSVLEALFLRMIEKYSFFKMRTVKFSCLPTCLDESAVYRQPYAKQFFPTPTTIAGVGARGSGKTYAMCLYNRFMFENGYFTRIYYIGPTLASNRIIAENTPLRTADVYEDRNAGPEAITAIEGKVVADVQWYEEITQMYKPLYEKASEYGFLSLNKEERKYMLEKQPAIEQYYETFLANLATVEFECPADKQILDGMLPMPTTRGVFITLQGEEDEVIRDEKMLEYLFRPPNLPRPAPVLFIDDMSHTSLYSASTENPLINLTLRHRHLGGAGYGITIEYAVQTFRAGMQRAMRANTMQYLLFKTHAIGVLENVYEELGAFTTKEDFLRIYHYAVKDKHDFLLVDMNACHPDRVFRKNFEEFILSDIDETTTESPSATGKLDDPEESIVGEIPAVLPQKKAKKVAFAKQAKPISDKLLGRDEDIQLAASTQRVKKPRLT